MDRRMLEDLTNRPLYFLENKTKANIMRKSGKTISRGRILVDNIADVMSLTP